MPRKFLVFLLGIVAALPAADSLSQAAAKRGIYFGAAVQSGYIANDPTYAATLAREYSMIEPEYEMLWSTIHPAQNNYIWTGADKLVAYAQTNNVPGLRGSPWTRFPIGPKHFASTTGRPGTRGPPMKRLELEPSPGDATGAA